MHLILLTVRALTLDMISGRASRDYACGIKEGDVIPTVNTLSNLFGYFKAMRTCHSKLRYFDWDGQVHLAKGKTGGHQGDPLEMFIFNLTGFCVCRADKGVFARGQRLSWTRMSPACPPPRLLCSSR